MRRRRRQERGDHLVRICRGGRRQRRDAGRDRRAGQKDRHADFRSQCRRVSTARCSTSRRPSARPSTSSRASADLVATKRRIAIVAQSGGIGFAIKHRAKALGVAISYCVSAGNEADLGAGEFLDYMVQDASTDVILLFIEGIRDVDKFLAAARRAAEIGKPVIVTKVGRSGAGERAAASHTASMAGWSAAYDAVFAKYGFIVSNDLDEAVTIAAVLTTSRCRRATASPCSPCPAAPASGARIRCRCRACRCRNCRRRCRRKSESCCRPMARRATRSTSPRRACTAAACRRASICSTPPTRSTPSWWCCRCRATRGCRSSRPS